MNLKLIISDAILFFRTHLGRIASLCLPWLVATTVVEYLIASTGSPEEGIGPLVLIVWTFRLLVYPIYTGALIILMARRAKLEEPTNRELLESAVKIWQPFFIVHLFGEVMTSLGVMLFILPGIYIAARLAFAEFYIVLEDIKPMEAVQKSFINTRPHFMQIILLLILFAAPLIMARMFMGFYLSSIEAAPIFNVLGAVITDFILLFVDILLFRFFMSATQEKPANDI